MTQKQENQNKDRLLLEQVAINVFVVFEKRFVGPPPTLRMTTLERKYLNIRGINIAFHEENARFQQLESSNVTYKHCETRSVSESK